MDQIDEYEQGERVRAWLKKNGSSLITGVALGLAALAGWQWWEGQGEQAKVEPAGKEGGKRRRGRGRGKRAESAPEAAAVAAPAAAAAAPDEGAKARQRTRKRRKLVFG